jgi:hypothetical protein
MAIKELCDELKEDYQRAKLEPLISNFHSLFVSWVKKESGKDISFPNFHHLCVHFLDQCDYLGPAWATTTARDESFHQVMKAIIKDKSNNFDLSLQSLLKVCHGYIIFSLTSSTTT